MAWKEEETFEIMIARRRRNPTKDKPDINDDEVVLYDRTKGRTETGFKVAKKAVRERKKEEGGRR